MEMDPRRSMGTEWRLNQVEAENLQLGPPEERTTEDLSVISSTAS